MFSERAIRLHLQIVLSPAKGRRSKKYIFPDSSNRTLGVRFDWYHSLNRRFSLIETSTTFQKRGFRYLITTPSIGFIAAVI